MIYFIKMDQTDIVKIGYAHDPFKRLKSLQTGNPFKLSIFYTMDGDCRLEKDIHDLFLDYKMYGEWFKCHDLVVEFIEHIKINNDWPPLEQCRMRQEAIQARLQRMPSKRREQERYNLQIEQRL